MLDKLHELNQNSNNQGSKIYIRKSHKYVHEKIEFNELVKVSLLFGTPLQYILENPKVEEQLKQENLSKAAYHKTPESAKDIPHFIKSMNIDMSAFQHERAEDYPTFNDFFIREVKPERRPIAAPEDNRVLVSPADCRLSVYSSVAEAKKLYIKGKKFDVQHLLGGSSNQKWIDMFQDAYMLNARLSPVDYHRYHAPLGGTVLTTYSIPGMNFETRPTTLESQVNVLTDNEREVTILQSESYAYCFVAIGASAVGCCVTKVKEGDTVKKGDEIGYFQFGGSDIVILFNKPVLWDQDLLEKSSETMETLVEANERIGGFKSP